MDEVLKKHSGGAKLQVYTIWERVMKSDNEAPSTDTLARVSWPGAQQFWDPDRLVSKSMGETDESSIVWDCVFIYPPGTRWDTAPGAKPPVHTFTARPVVDKRDEFDRALP